MAPPILLVENLKTHFFTHFGTVKAVDDVGFAVERGQILGIVGESGSGKSMTALSILGMVPYPGRVVDGRIHFQGTDLSQIDLKTVRGKKISMVFQDPMTSLNPVFRVGDQIAEVYEIHEGLGHTAALQKALQMMALVGIPEPKQRLRDYPHQLSGGMRQRVMIAIALACNPALLIADEPTTALDVTIQAQILALMRDLNQRTGASIMLITHDLGVIAEMAQMVMVMYAGNVMEYGDVRRILKSPAHPYTRALLKSIPRVTRKQTLSVIPGMVPSLLDPPSGCRFNPRCDHAADLCRVEHPGLKDLGHQHFVRCHRPQVAAAL